uniref:Uncharacterized protein n=1 Tax=Anopheles culicifacies TaxID=139723 RepID=A0A182MCZ1_9DIPT
MAPSSTIFRWLLLCAACAFLEPISAGEFYTNSRPVTESGNATCPDATAVRDVKPQNCCHSFLGLHNAIIDCLSRPVSGITCIGYCLVQNFRAQKMLTSMSLTVSNLIAVGPKLIAHYEQCHNHLLEFAVGNPFNDDFRRIVCDDRLEAFFECMVKMWLLDCMGYDDTNAKCVELQNVVKTSECRLQSFFTNIGTK